MERQSQLIHRLFALIDTADWAQLTEVFAADAIYHRPGYADVVGVHNVVHFYREIRDVQSGRHELLGVIADTTCGCCWGRFEGTSRSGQRLSEYFAEWYEFTNTVISDRRTFFFRPAI